MTGAIKEYTLKSVEGLMFLSYLTKYNISAIFDIVEKYGDIEISKFIDEYKGTSQLSENGLTEIINETTISAYKLDYYRVKTETVFSSDYPAKLKKIKNPPPVLYYKSNAKLKRSKLAAIVGTRESTNAAHKIIPLLVDVFQRNGYGIISGLAHGIDSIAHHAAVEQKVYTAAIMPNSLDTIYPKENYKLANLILSSGGALVSELCFGISHGKRSFVQRNRIQAGISDIVMPIEMGIKSGTMTTIEFAYEQEKYILIVQPGEKLSQLPQYDGINYLIRKMNTEKYKRTIVIKELVELDRFLNSNSTDEQATLFT